MAADAATNPVKRDLDFEYDFVSIILQFQTNKRDLDFEYDFVSIILQFQTKNDTKLYNICHKTRYKTAF